MATVVSHDLLAVLRLPGRLLVMQDGRILEKGRRPSWRLRLLIPAPGHSSMPSPGCATPLRRNDRRRASTARSGARAQDAPWSRPRRRYGVRAVVRPPVGEALRRVQPGGPTRRAPACAVAHRRTDRDGRRPRTSRGAPPDGRPTPGPRPRLPLRHRTTWPWPTASVTASSSSTAAGWSSRATRRRSCGPRPISGRNPRRCGTQAAAATR